MGLTRPSSVDVVNKGVRVEPTRRTIQATFKGDPEAPGLCSAIIFLLISHCLRFAFWSPLRSVTAPTRRLPRGPCLGDNVSSGTESAPVPAWPHEGPPGRSFKRERSQVHVFLPIFRAMARVYYQILQKCKFCSLFIRKSGLYQPK